MTSGTSKSVFIGVLGCRSEKSSLFLTGVPTWRMGTGKGVSSSFNTGVGLGMAGRVRVITCSLGLELGTLELATGVSESMLLLPYTNPCSLPESTVKYNTIQYNTRQSDMRFMAIIAVDR